MAEGDRRVVDRRWILALVFGLVAVAFLWTGFHPRHPLWPLGLGSLLLVGTISCAVSCIGSGLFGPVVIRGVAGRRMLALTFDDGPDPDHTLRIARMLEQGGHRGTFFALGKHVERHPEIVRELVERGHDVGIHSWDHATVGHRFVMTALREDFRRASAAVAGACGRWPRFYRPPVGLLNPRVIRVAREGNWLVVGWSHKGRDGVRADPAAVARRVSRGLYDGAVVLMHDRIASGEPAALGALPEILARLEEAGLRSVALSELVDCEAYARKTDGAGQMV